MLGHFLTTFWEDFGKGTPTERHRKTTGNSQENQRNTTGNTEGNPKENQRKTRGKPKETQRNIKGKPKERQRNTKGKPQENQRKTKGHPRETKGTPKEKHRENKRKTKDAQGKPKENKTKGTLKDQKHSVTSFPWHAQSVRASEASDAREAPMGLTMFVILVAVVALACPWAALFTKRTSRSPCHDRFLFELF